MKGYVALWFDDSQHLLEQIIRKELRNMLDCCDSVHVIITVVVYIDFNAVITYPNSNQEKSDLANR
jgi:hypothetical protein